MSLTSKDIEEIEGRPFVEPRFTKIALSIVKVAMRIPPIRVAVGNSVGGLSGKIFQAWAKNDFKSATDISIYALERYRNKKSWLLPIMDHHFWWRFMKHGVDSVKRIDDSGLRERFIEIAKTGIAPFEGYDVAYSFLEFSRWRYQQSRHDEAFEFAQIATSADPTWAEPEFVLGWYGLVLRIGDAESHLRRAIDRDKRMLFRIANNEICKQYPHILNRLKSVYRNSPPNNTIETDT